jgi:hypothetical protein
MKIYKFLSLFLVVALTVSCQKNEIEYNATTFTDLAQFQLHYFVPVNAVAANNITKVLINDSLYANSKAPLTTYNAIPNGGVGRFYTVDPGTVNIKLYQGTAGDVLVYDQNVDLTTSKQNVFVHDFSKPPVVFDNGYPYSYNITENSDSTCWIKFYNFLYETSGVPSSLKLQYQYIDTRTLVPVNIGQPVSFGETTDWQPVKVVKSIFNTAGYNKIDFLIKVINGNGNVVSDLQYRNTSGVYKSYGEFFNAYIGRRYHCTLSGMRAAAPAASVRQFTAL